MLLKDAVQQLLDRQGALMRDANTTKHDLKALEADWIRLLNQHPDEPLIMFSLGSLEAQLGKEGIAIALTDRCRQFGNFGADPWLNMAIAYKCAHLDERAKECYQKAIEAAQRSEKPEDLAHSYHGMASLHINASRPKQCIYWAEKALKIDPNDRFALWNKGLAHLELGEWEEGWRLYDEAGFMDGGNKPPERKLKTYGGLPKWDGTPGKTVITYGEQGVGDEIMFCSILPDLMKDCRVIVDCDPRLEKMLKRSFPELEGVYPTSDVNASFPWIRNHKPDAYIPMGTLGRFYRNKTEDFPKVPFLKADPDKVAKWAEILKPFTGLRVGISWAGGLKKTRFDKRTIPLAQWEPILKMPGIDFFSLQYHQFAPDETAKVGNAFGVPIHHWHDMIADYEETAGFLENLDCVFTVNTSLHHLCGGLGVVQYCFTPKYVAWRYGTAGPSPWYGNCTMLRQPHDDDWSRPFELAINILKSKAAARAREAA